MPANYKNLLDKNIKTEMRSWRKIILEALIILGLFVVIDLYPLGHSTASVSSDLHKTNIYDVQNIEDLTQFNGLLHITRKSRYLLAYTPINNYTEEITQAVADKLGLFGIKPFESEMTMENEFEKRTMLAGIVYTGFTSTYVPKHLNISIRFPSLFRTLPKRTDTWDALWVTRCSGIMTTDEHDATDYKQSDLYIREGFLQLQYQIFNEWVKMLISGNWWNKAAPQANNSGSDEFDFDENDDFDWPDNELLTLHASDIEPRNTSSGANGTGDDQFDCDENDNFNWPYEDNLTLDGSGVEPRNKSLGGNGTGSGLSDSDDDGYFEWLYNENVTLDDSGNDPPNTTFKGNGTGYGPSDFDEYDNFKWADNEDLTLDASDNDPTNTSDGSGDRGTDISGLQVLTKIFRHHTTKSICQAVTRSNFLEFLYYFSFLYTFLNILWKYGREHEENILVHHGMYGYNHCSHWLAHISVTMIHLLVFDVLIVLLVKTNITGADSFYEISFMYVILFLILYNIAMILFAILVVLLFANARNAVLFGLTIWLAAYALFFVVLNHTVGLQSLFVMCSFLLFFNNAFGYGMSFMENYDDRSGSGDMLYLLGVMVVNIVLTSFLITVCQYYWPGRYMHRLNSFWPCCGPKTHSKDEPEKSEKATKVVILAERLPSWHNFEFGPVGAQEYVRLRNVCTASENHTARHHLKRITMRIYKGEITVLLGHHHSGKTTLVRSVAGWWKPSEGKIEVMQVDVYKNWKEARSHMDVSMPNNALFDLLSVGETLEYFVRVKTEGWEEQRVHMEVDHWLGTIKPSVRDGNRLIKNLTFEQKRLVCLCIALSGGTKVVLLDQPMRHMCSTDARLYNTILQKEKPDRAILVTTYAIDEAELIGDRIGILYHGVLKAYGTPFFLRTKFGLEYSLIIIHKEGSPSERITAQIAKYLPTTKLDNEIGNQLVYKISAEKRPQFQQMLIHLEREREPLGIEIISLVSCELCDVYALLGYTKNNQVMPEYTKKLKVAYLAKKAIRQQQMRAMFYKKLIHQAPNFIPIILITVSVLLILFLGHLSRVLTVPPVRFNSIDLGFNNTAKVLPPIPENCKTVKITSVKVHRATRQVNSQSFLFTEKSFACLHEGFEGHLRSDVDLQDKIGAVEGSDNNYIIWVNQRFFHSAPMALNVMQNMWLREHFPTEKDIKATIQNDPFFIPLRTKIHLLDQQLSHLRLPLTMGVILPITTSLFILQLVEERSKHLLDLQVIAGMPMDIYWIVTFVWDYLTYLIYMIIYVVVMAFTLLDGITMDNKMITFLVLSVYGVPALLMTYFISMFFNASRLRAFLMCINIQLITGLCAYVFYWDVLNNNIYFFYIMSLSPTFSLLDGISNIYAESKEQEYCADKCKHIENCDKDNMCELLPQCCAQTFFKFEDPGILVCIVYMVSVSLIFGWSIFWLTLRREDRKFHIPERVKTMRSACYPYDDVDVVTVKKGIAEPDMRVYRQKRFVVDQLEAVIPKHARELHTISFSLHKTVCLCIYGTRHSGKTHLTRQMAGLDGFSFGEIYLLGLELKYDLPLVYKVLGYCPQDRGLFNTFQVNELLHVICMIRGVPGAATQEILRDLAMTLDMSKIMKKKIGNLTVDQQRKINIAIAMIAYNKVIIVDEPTSGLPAAGCREIWNILRYARFCNKTVICTTFNTMECQALADQVLIVDDGEMLAIGGLQYLRTKYSIGFYLEVKLKRDGKTADEATENLRKDIENLHRFMSFLHGKSELRSRTDNWFKYYVPVENTSYSYLYGALEKNKRRLNITDYLVSNGTMEDAMVNIAQKRLHKKAAYLN